MDVAGRIRRLRRALRRRERVVVAAYLAVTAAALALTCAPPLRDPLLDRAEWLTVRAGERWALRVDAAAEDLAAARAIADPVRRQEALDTVTAGLAALDRIHPARSVRFARDAERVRLMRLVVEAHTAAGRKGSALDAVRRLVAFDPRRYRSHLLHAETALGFGEEEEAWAAFQEVLRIHPNHLPSVRTLVGLRADAGDWAGARVVFERYLEAFWLSPVEVRVDGAAAVRVHVPVDGAWHALDLPLASAVPADARAAASSEAPLEVEALRLVPALRAGGAGAPSEDARALRVRLRARLRKPVDPALWDAVERSYRNLLAWEELKAARARVAVVEASPS